MGKKEQNAEQKADMARVFATARGAGVLDLVTAWYVKAAEVMQANPATRSAFVSTNSITQGEQVSVLWSALYERGMHIQFAHRTFKWSNEARGKAAVHCVIIGFGQGAVPRKRLFIYEAADSESHEAVAENINPYLADAVDALVVRRESPICDVPKINKGSEATDFGHLFLEPDERAQLLVTTPGAERWLRRVYGGDELINGIERWCLWLSEVRPDELRQMPDVLARVERVRKARAGSGKARTREWAARPSLFSENRQPDEPYLAVPKVSSERRSYLPIGFLAPDVIATGSLQVVPGATSFHFGVLSSAMHMAWMRYTCGRMKSDYQYSNNIVYNNFPWPELPCDKYRSAIDVEAQGVLDVRSRFPGSTLADLYDPLTMPPALVKAHQQLDKVVDAAYLAAEKVAGRKTPRIGTDAERVAFLFDRYQQLVSILPTEKSKRPARRAP